MAAKVNSRLLIVVVLGFAAALALLGGVYVLKMRGDATRSFRKGEEAFAKGDFKTAYDQYGRALSKDPGNLQYLAKAEESLLKLVPATATEAQESYNRFLATLGHAAVHNPTDPKTHLRMINELFSTARRSDDLGTWETLAASADNMNQRVVDGDDLKPLAKTYKALAISRLAETKSEEDLQLAIEDADQASALLGNNDLAAAATIRTRLAQLGKMEVAGKSQTTLDAQRDALVLVAQRAIEAAPKGPETALAYLNLLLVRNYQTPDSVGDEDLQSAADHLVSSIAPSDDSGLIGEATGLLLQVPSAGGTGGTGGASRERAMRVLNAAVAGKERAYDLQVLQAILLAETNQLDESERLVREILNAPQLPVSFMSRMQYALRPRVASLLGDIEFRRYEPTPIAERPAQMQKMKDARELLASMSPDPTNDALLIRADAKIAFAQQQYVDAAAKFEQLVRLSNSNDGELLAFDAIALQQIGQIGLAHERITAALATNPGAIQWMLAKANMELLLGRPQDAARTIEPIPDTALSDPRAQQIVSLVRRAASMPSTAPAGNNPVQIAIASAQESMDKNEVENARAALIAALQEHTDDLSLLQALALVEVRAGNRDLAAQYVDRGLKANPTDRLLNQLSAGLRFEDPIQATGEFLKATIVDDKQRLNAMLVSMTNLMDQQRAAAARLKASGNQAEADAATQIADRAMAQADTAAEDLAKADPENAQLLEFRFAQALRDKNWTKAAELVATAKRLNLDSVEGRLFQGRLELAQGNTREAILSLESATDKLSFSSFAWRLLAVAYQSTGNFAQAERAFEQAYRCNPNDISGAQAYLNLLSRRGDKTRALQILRGVRQLAPDDVNLREGWLSLEAEVGNSAVALRERSKLYAATPSDTDNAAALARLLVTLEPSRETILNESGEPKYPQQRWLSLSGVEQDEIRKESREEWAATADTIVKDLSKSSPDDLRVVVLKATVLRERGDVNGGESVIREFIDRHDKSKQTEDMFIELGRYQANANHFNDALASLREGVALGGPQQRAAEVNLGLLQMQLRQYDEALKSFESAKAKEDDPTLRLRIIECLINVGRLDDAEKGLAEVATGTGGSVATLLQAQIAKTRGDQLVAKGDIAGAAAPFNQQRELLAKAEQLDPTNPLPRILLAQSLIDEYNRTLDRAVLDDAMVALDNAERIRPGSLEVSTLRVLIQKEQGNRSGAIAELQRSLESNPGNVAARRDLVQLLLEAGDTRGARAAVDAAIQQNPTLGLWHEAKGDLLVQSRGDMNEVIASYNTAYDRTPSNLMLLKLADAMLITTPPKCRAVIEKLASRESEMNAEPTIREAYARALACDGKRDLAIEQMRLAYARRAELIAAGSMPPEAVSRWFNVLSLIYPGGQAADGERLANELANGKSNVFEIAGLAAYWLRTGDSGSSRALELQRQAVALCPTDNSNLRATLNSDLGDMLVLSGDLQGAAEAYDVVLRIRPADINALNNLAYLKAEKFNDVAGALPLVERLATVAANNPNALDTVGWVYFRTGDLEKAKQFLGQSIALRPAAETYTHLAYVLAKSGDAIGAEQRLAEAEKLAPSPEVQQEIKALRDDMKKAGG